MDDAAQDALLADIVQRMLRLRRKLPHHDFDELAGTLLMDLDVAEMEAAGRDRPCRSRQNRTGTVVPFPGASGRGTHEPPDPARPWPNGEE